MKLQEIYTRSHLKAGKALFTLAVLAVSFLISPLPSYASELSYTIQTGSYVGVKDAGRHFESVRKALTGPERDYLRIEKVGRYYTVRIGKFERYAEAGKLHQKVTRVFPGADIMEAYIKQERIVKLHSGSGKFAAKETLPVPAADQAVYNSSGLVYTIQTGSYVGVRDAGRHFESVKQALSGRERDYLRIEKVGQYYTVRLGKFERYAEAGKLLHSVAAGFPGAEILEAYIKEERIVKTYPETRPETDPAGRERAGHDQYSEAVRMAKAMVREGRNSDALTTLKPFASQPSEYPVAVSDYIATLVWEEKYSEAVNMYEALPESFVKRAYLLKNIAKAYYERGNYSGAFINYEAAINETPSDREVQKGVVYSLTRMGEHIRALEYANTFMPYHTDSTEMALTRADLLVKLSRYAEAMNAYREIGQRNGADSGMVLRHRDDTLTSLPPEKQQAVIDALHDDAREDKELFGDYLAVLVLYEHYDSAVRTVESMNMDVSQYPADLQSMFAWALFKTGKTERAKQIYENIVNDEPDYYDAWLGLSYAYSRGGEGDKAIRSLDSLLSEHPDDLRVKFARAYAYEQTGRFWNAVKEYDRVLAIDPENTDAKRLRLIALSDIGASTHAGEEVRKEFPSDTELQETFKGDEAVDRIKWKEFPAAKDILQLQSAERKNIRAKGDYVMALAENTDMEEALRVYEQMLSDGTEPPPWVLAEAAKAYLYLEQPYKALELYDTVLEVQPNYEIRMGRFYTLQELRKWEEAKKAINNIDSDTPIFLSKGKEPIPNWEKSEVKLAKGWLLLEEDRLGEGQQYFQDLHEKAPAYSHFRTGVSYAYLWRGWPRKALREFNIGNTLDPKAVNNELGRIMALNELAFKDQAREEARELLRLHPRHKHVQALVRQLELEEMDEIFVDFTVSSDDDDFQEVRAYTKLTHPISLYTNVYGFLLWQKSEEESMEQFYRRAGLGLEHIFNSTWKAKQQLSLNYNDGNDFGSYTEVEFTPDDYWILNAYYDSFTTDVPLRARVFDIEAKKANLKLTYRESEWRSYSLTYSHLDFSDDNTRNQGLFSYEQGLYVRNNWKMRLFVDLYASSNSRDDAPYFNPENDFSVTATHMTEHTARLMYRKAFFHRLYLSLGMYDQSGFSNGITGGARYEHDIDFEDTHSLLYGVSLDRNIYDGEAVSGYSFYVNWRLLF